MVKTRDFGMTTRLEGERFFVFVFAVFGFLGAVFFAGRLATGLDWCFAGVGAAFGGIALDSIRACVFPFSAGFCAATGAGAAAAAAAFALPFPASPCFPATAGAGAPAAALGPRPRLGGGGGGGGGGANGFRNLKVSVRERSLPSSNNMNTSRAILGYSGNCGVISSSVISGRGIRLWTWRLLVRKFLIFCATACWREVTARNKTISGRADESKFQVREGVAASLLFKRLARTLA